MRFLYLPVLLSSLCWALQEFPPAAGSLPPAEALVKKPIVRYDAQSIHQFNNTPYKDYDKFINSVIEESAGVTFSEINDLNGQIRPEMVKVTHENFFRIFRLDLFKQCPFWSGTEGFCMHRSCAVDTIDDWKDLPAVWQPEALGAIENASPASQDNSKDYCEIDEVNEDTVYVDLVQNPERFTGYGGDQSFQIWKSIYSENCFNLGHDQCVEKNFYYKLISGMHASISTHLSNEYLDLKTKQYGPNLKQFMFRVGDFPDRIENIYLNYIIVLKALIKLESSGILDNLEFSDDEQFRSKEVELKDELRDIIKPSYHLGDDTAECLFDENSLFQSADAAEIKDEIKENFRNVSRIMDCVHCDRCRLWGKVQTTGYGTALKVLFDLQKGKDYGNSTYDISKVELIALVNTFDRLSRSVESIKNFKKMYDVAIKAEEEGERVGEEDDAGNSISNVSGVDSSSIVGDQVDFTNPDVFESGGKIEAEYNDIVFPYKGKNTVKAAFYTELNNVWGALQLIFRSYQIFPKVVYNWCLIRVVYYWNKFVGHVQQDFDVNRLYHQEL
ncbi:DEKNAAC105386 [Brettanomyces naardenensis]|uniref:DEKNAAC105386 n=1 Tax=Brettanomyces naardenensis TaxID=13370 RepID=A0A448YTC9_BRENA|nr:DEKNAAC105386 [Brettanomyces naardenensis]